MDVSSTIEAKQQLRRTMRGVRSRLAGRDQRSARLWAEVAVLCDRSAARVAATDTGTAPRAVTVLAFQGIGSEPDTTELVGLLEGRGHTVLLPRVEGDHVVGVAHRRGDALHPGAFGIPEPVGPAVDPHCIDIALVPGLAFTPDGKRLGQGGGFYDRFLPLLRPDAVTCGVGFTEQVLDDLPSEPHDHRLTMLLTGGRIRMAVPFTVAELDAAAALVGRFVSSTPQYAWPMLADAVGTEVWVKHENHTPTGAFKVRGGLVYVDRHVRDADARGVRPRPLISATRGNHGQSLAFAGRAFGVDVTIVVPHGNSPDKNAAMRGFGATLIEEGRDFQAAREHAQWLAVERDLHMVPSFHPDLVLGVATAAREFLTGAPELDVVYVPVGMGSGICAHIAVRDLLGLETEIVGVVAEGAPATALSFAAGHVVNTEVAETFIDGVACRAPDDAAIRAIVAGASRIVQVSDDLCAEAMRILFRTTHNVPEPSGAAALAGLLAERDQHRGRRVGVTMSGGNADAAPFVQVLTGTTPRW